MMQRKATKYVPMFAAIFSSALYAQDGVLMVEEQEAVQAQADSAQNSGALITGDQVQAQQAAQGLTTQPVVVTPAMRPRAVTPTQTALPSNLQGDPLVSGVDTNVKNTSNSGSGVQQIVNVGATAKNDNENTNDIVSAAEALRRLRTRKELMNESRLIEKIEEDRIHSENMRSNVIEGFTTNNASVKVENSQVDTLQVVPVSAQAVEPVAATPVAQSTVVNNSAGSRDSAFSLIPMAGYRWYQNSILSTYQLKNQYVLGVSLEGKLNKYIGLESTFAYGRDRVNVTNYAANSYTSYPCYYCSGYGYGYGYYYGYYGYAPAYYVANTGGVVRRDTYEITGGVKLGVPVNILRPFVAGSLGYLYQEYKNNDPYYNSAMLQQGLSRSTDYVLGNVGGGIDIAANENIAIGVRFDYQALLNKKASSDTLLNGPTMDSLYGDSENRYRLMGHLQLTF